MSGPSTEGLRPTASRAGGTRLVPGKTLGTRGSDDSPREVLFPTRHNMLQLEGHGCRVSRWTTDAPHSAVLLNTPLG